MSRIQCYLLLSLASPLIANSEVVSTSRSLRHASTKNDNKENAKLLDGSQAEGIRNLISFSDLLPPNDEEPPIGEQPPQQEEEEEESPTVEEESTEAPEEEEVEAELAEGEVTEAPEELEDNYDGDPSQTEQATQQEPPPQPEVPEANTTDPIDSVPGSMSSPSPTAAPKSGDFTKLNQLLRNTVIQLPDTDISEELLFQPLTINLIDLECSQVSFEDIKLTSEYRSRQDVGVDFSMAEIGIQCEFDFRWSYIFLSGNGHSMVEIGDSSIDAALDFHSKDFELFPPENATVTNCATDINILGLDFSGNIASEIFNIFEDTIIGVLDGLLNEKICVELNNLGSELLGDALSLAFGLIEPFLEPIPEWRYNVSYPELTMEVPEDVTLISWMDEDGFGEFFDAVLVEIDDSLGGIIRDYDVPNGTTLAFPNGTEYPEGGDLGINVLLRRYLLNEERTFHLDQEDIEDMNTSTILYGGQDHLTETTLTLKAIKVHGLDTFTNFEPFKRFGNFTLQNVLSWDFLSFEAVLEMEVKASSLEDSYIRDAQRVDPYVEQLTISIGVDNLDAIITVMFALDPQKMMNLQAGSILELTSMLPCVAASLHDVALAGLNISIGDIRMPTVEGLVSRGVDRLVADAVAVGFFMFKGTVLQAIPSLFESTIRDLITEALEGLSCPEFILPEEDSFVDVRDLLLNKDESMESGATGEAPYGDLAATFYGIGQSLWQAVESDGTLGLNSFIITPVTLALSGKPGLLNLPGELFNFTTDDENQMEFKTLVNRFEFAIFDLRIDNLDTVVHPMAVIQPVNHPYITESRINMGPLENRPLNLTLGMRMALDIEDSPLAMNNIVNMGFSVASLELYFDILTMISTTGLLNFRLGEGFNMECWFAAIPPPLLDESGYRIEEALDQGIEMRKFLTRISDLKLFIDCIECSPGLASLPEIVDTFDRTKVTDVLGYRLPLFVEEIAISDTVQVTFDRWLVEAPYYCPHREEYNVTYEPPEEWEVPEFSELSLEASDTIFFTAFVLAEVAVVLLTETHYPWNTSSLEPLSGQELFVPDEGSDIADWMNISKGFDDLADDLRAYISENATDEETGIYDIGINHVIRDFLVDEDGVFDVVQFLGEEPLEFSVSGVVVAFHSIKISGLDTFTRFDILKPIAPQTILNSMHLEHLDLEFNVSTGSRTDPPQHIVAKLSLSDLNATIPLFAAFDMNKFNELELGHFLLGGGIFPCSLAAAAGIHFPKILLTIGNFSVPTFEGFLPDSGQALKDSVMELYERYATRFLKALPVMFDVTARTFINTFIADFIADKAKCTHIKEYVLNMTPPTEVPYPFTDYVDFRELLMMDENATDYGARGNVTYGNTIRSLTYPLQEELLWVNPETGLSSFNGVIRAATSFLSDEEGMVFLAGDVFEPIEVYAEIGALLANISFSVGDLRIQNLDTMGDPLSFLDPIKWSPFEMGNSVGVGLGGRPIRFSMRFSIDVVTVDDNSGEIDQDIQNDMIITLDMEQAEALFTVFALLSEDRMVHFPIEDITNPYCWLALMPAPELDERGIRLEGESPTVSLRDLAVSVAKLNMTIACQNCTSPGMQALSDALSKAESVAAITSVANSLFQFGTSLISGNLIQDQLDRLLNEAGRQCPHDPRYTPDADGVQYEPLNFDRSVSTSSLLLLLITVAFCLIVALLAATVIVKWIVRRRHKRWLRTLPALRVHILQHQQESDEQMEDELNQDTSAMVSAEEIPKRVRYGMPILIIGNIAFFVSGHISIAAETFIEAKVAGEQFTLERFFAFSIMKSTVDMWEAGAKEMAIFLIIFSGIWPYVKQFISLYCWFVSPNRLSISTRGSTFLWLDTLAKWSMVDIFVMYVSMVSFRVRAITPDVVFLPPDFFSLQVIVVPQWGLYANLIAQMISQVSSHFIIHYHRAIVRRASRKYEERHASMNNVQSVRTAEDSDEHSGEADAGDKKDERSRLCDAAFARPHKGEYRKLVARQIASYGLVVGTFLLVLFLILGCSLSSLSVDIQGAISFVSGAGDGVYKEFNVFSIATQLMTDAEFLGGAQYIGYFLLASVFILTVFIVPVLQAAVLVYHWFRPMNDQERKTCSIVIEILSAWQYAEVFILALFVSSWQLAPTSEAIMADQCEEFESIFEMLAYYDVLERTDSHCFRVEATIMNGAYLLVSGALLLGLLNTFVMKASFQYFWDQESCRKELALKDHLTPEEAASSVDEEVFKKIRPPPVMFTDTFRWLLRPEHLGGRPLQGIVAEEQSQGSSTKEGDQENISSASSASL